MAGKVPYSREVDIWSLGCVLYNMLVGRPPFSSEKYRLETVLDKVKNGEIDVLLEQHMDDFTDAAFDLVCRLLQLQPQHRLKSEEVLDHPFISGELSPSQNGHVDSGYCASSSPASNRKPLICKTNNSDPRDIGYFRRRFLSKESGNVLPDCPSPSDPSPSNHHTTKPPLPSRNRPPRPLATMPGTSANQTACCGHSIVRDDFVCTGCHAVVCRHSLLMQDDPGACPGCGYCPLQNQPDSKRRYPTPPRRCGSFRHRRGLSPIATASVDYIPPSPRLAYEDQDDTENIPPVPGSSNYGNSGSSPSLGRRARRPGTSTSSAGHSGATTGSTGSTSRRKLVALEYNDIQLGRTRACLMENDAFAVRFSRNIEAVRNVHSGNFRVRKPPNGSLLPCEEELCERLYRICVASVASSQDPSQPPLKISISRAYRSLRFSSKKFIPRNWSRECQTHKYSDQPPPTPQLPLGGGDYPSRQIASEDDILRRGNRPATRAGPDCGRQRDNTARYRSSSALPPRPRIESRDSETPTPEPQQRVTNSLPPDVLKIPSNAVEIPSCICRIWMWNSASQSKVQHIRFDTGEEILTKRGTPFFRYFPSISLPTSVTYRFDARQDWPTHLQQKYCEIEAYIN